MIKTERDKIQELIFTWGRTIDDRDYRGIADCFTDDAEFNYAEASRFGGPAVAEFVKAAVIQFDGTQHFFTNFIVDVDGDSASFTCDSFGQHWRKGAEGGEKWMAAGHYNVDVQRTGDDWKIRRATIRIMWTDGNEQLLQRGW